MPASPSPGVSDDNLVEGSLIALVVSSAHADPPRLIALGSAEPIG